MRKLPQLVWGSFLLLCGISSCLDDVDYSTSESDRLRFSTDTVDFDTVISGQLTNTYTFQVYNPNKKALRIPQVYLESGAESPYRVNVDGTFLEEGRGGDFEILSEDSLRVFLSLNAPDRDSDVPVKETDKLIFLTEGGAKHEVVFSAYGQSVIPLHGKCITADTTLVAGRPYQILDSLYVAPGATLTLAEGVQLYFHPTVEMRVDGTLIANGSLQSPIMMRGDRLGNMFSKQPYDRIPGQWGGVILGEKSVGNQMRYCDIHSGTFGIRCDSSDVEIPKLHLENSIVHNMSGDVLSVRSSKVFVGNSQLTNAGGNCVTLRGGHSTFVHCTIANFYAFAGGRGVALDFSNTDVGDIRLPLHQAAFYNTIITGYSDDEIMGSKSERYENDPFNYLFSHCLLNTPKYEDEKVQNCIWDEDDEDNARENNFYPEFDLKQLIFTFGLAKNSKAVNAADPSIAENYYPTDRLGRSRFLDEGPDLGCQEADLTQFEEQEKEEK